MGAIIEVNVKEIKQLVAKLNAYALSDIEGRKLLHSLGQEHAEQTKDRFDEERDPEGNKWKALTEPYATRKRNGWRKRDGTRESGSRGGILVRRRHLSDIIFQVQGSGASVLVGSAMEYADYHQNAKKENRRRRFLGLNSGNIADLSAAIDVFMKGKAGG